jgi:prophage regulatory protein
MKAWLPIKCLPTPRNLQMKAMTFQFEILPHPFVISGQPQPKPQPKSQPQQLQPLPDRVLRLDTVMLLTGLSRATLWRMERESRFPKRVKIGKRAVAWRETEIRDWLARRSG